MVGIGSIHKRLYGTAEIILAAVVVGLYLFPGCNDGYSIYDEGIAIYGAERVFHGQVPYRDFWTMYAPGQYYLLALLFKLFGMSLMVERVASALIAAALCTFIYAIVRSFTGRAIAVMCVMIAAVWMGGLKMFGSPMPTALMLALGSALTFVSFISTQHRSYLIISGLLAGAAALFRHDIGVYTLTAEVVMTAVSAMASRSRTSPGAEKKGGNLIRPVVLLAGGFALIVIPAAAYLLSRVPLADIYADLIWFPSTVYPHVRRLPFPLLWANCPTDTPARFVRALISPSNPSFPFYIPIAVYLIGVVYFVRIIVTRKRQEWSSRQKGTIFFLVLGLFYFLQAIVRCDIHHFIPTFLPAIVVSGLLIFELLNQSGRGRPRLSGWIALLVVTVSALSVQRTALFHRFNLIRETVTGETHCRIPFERAAGIRVDGDCSAYADLIGYLRKAVPQGEKIYVGNSRHDRIAKNDILLYFLADRESAVRYHELHPGLATTEAVQREIIAALESEQVQYVVLAEFSGDEPNGSSKSSGVHVLDNYLRDNYGIAKSFGNYSVCRRMAGSSDDDRPRPTEAVAAHIVTNGVAPLRQRQKYLIWGGQ